MTTSQNCVTCGQVFIKPSKSKTVTCSKSCSSRLICRNRGIKNQINCKICGSIFSKVSSNGEYCNQKVMRKCKGCENSFERLCNNHLGDYCSTSCRNKYMRAKNYQIKERVCIFCKEMFTPNTSKQKTCLKTHYQKCEFCLANFPQDNERAIKGTNKFCDNTCSTLAQMNSKIPKNLIAEYKDPDLWAKTFRKNFGRKPNTSDFRVYFQVKNSARHYDPKNFIKRSSSDLETAVVQHIENFYPQLKIIRLFRKKFPIGLRELDIFLPDFNIGFEVQDFKTHSKTSDTEISFFGPNKKGPIYHEEKRSLFLGFSISVFDVWEDEIISKTFGNRISALIDRFDVSPEV